MDNSNIIPSKIHLTNIKTEKENTILFDGKLAVKPTYDIKVAHSMMHNLEKELVKIKNNSKLIFLLAISFRLNLLYH